MDSREGGSFQLWCSWFASCVRLVMGSSMDGTSTRAAGRFHASTMGAELWDFRDRFQWALASLPDSRDGREEDVARTDAVSSPVPALVCDVVVASCGWFRCAVPLDAVANDCSRSSMADAVLRPAGLALAAFLLTPPRLRRCLGVGVGDADVSNNGDSVG